MDEGIDFKKLFIIAFIAVGGFFYIKSHYTFHDVLAYTKKHPSPEWSPKIDYYIGTIQFLRDQPAESQFAYNQLLADYPTSYYTPKALFRLGTIHKDKSEWSLAREFYQRYIDEYPQGEDIELVKKQFEYIKFK